MAGRVPVGSHRSTVAREMENTFIQNLRYAADVLSKVGGLLCPRGSRGADQVTAWWWCQGSLSMQTNESSTCHYKDKENLHMLVSRMEQVTMVTAPILHTVVRKSM